MPHPYLLAETLCLWSLIFNSLRSDLECLREVWNTWRAVQEQHTEWKRGRWQRINTKLMKKATEAQIDVVTALPFESHEWDVFVGMHHAILDIQVSFVNREVVPISVEIRSSHLW